jgi:hypothetical protein
MKGERERHPHRRPGNPAADPAHPCASPADSLGHALAGLQILATTSMNSTLGIRKPLPTLT